jgi:hypothetical protein
LFGHLQNVYVLLLSNREENGFLPIEAAIVLLVFVIKRNIGDVFEVNEFTIAGSYGRFLQFFQ